MKRLLYILPFLAVLLAIPSYTQAKTISEVLADARVLYLTGEYEKALKELDRLKPYVPVMKAPDKIELYKYLGFCHIAFGKIDEARGEFQEALKINPGLALDPTTVSPKIMEVFDEVKASMPAQQPPPSAAPEAKPAPSPAPSRGPARPAPVAKAAPRQPVVRPAPRPVAGLTPGQAALRSLALPGWGQYLTGQKVKGFAIMGVTAAAVGYLAYSHIAFSQAQSNYKSASDPVTASTAYDEYNKSNFSKNLSYIILGVVWAGNVADAYFLSPRNSTQQRSSLPLDITPLNGGVQVAYHYDF